MSAVKKPQPISSQDYLEGERDSTLKHEYVAGRVYAMAGASVIHNQIAANILGLSHAQLRGKKCQAFGSDMKVHIPRPPRELFYYPDVTIVCNSNVPRAAYQDQPVIIFEVLSDDTRRTDEGEKKEGYLALPSLAAYVLVEQESAALTVFRRVGNDFAQEWYEGLPASLSLQEVGVELKLAEIYERIEFSAAASD